jgi:hypothetical protein
MYFIYLLQTGQENDSLPLSLSHSQFYMFPFSWYAFGYMTHVILIPTESTILIKTQLNTSLVASNVDRLP